MTLYDEYRRQYPINPEPSEFRDIVESEVRRALAWRENLVDVKKWTEADYERAKELMAPLFDMIAEYESLHYSVAKPSKEEAESFRREQEKPLPTEEIKPGRYLMSETTEVMVDVVQGSNGLWVRSAWTYLPKQSWSLPLEYLTHKGATFQAVEEGI